MLQIKEVARHFKINPQTLYFYEKIGLIKPQRTEAGYRIFSDQDLERLTFITRAKSLGLTLKEIKEILTLKDGKSLTCQSVYVKLEQKIKTIQEQIQQLQLLEKDLLILLEKCQINLENSDPDSQCIILDQN